jgi:hypothetical protein
MRVKTIAVDLAISLAISLGIAASLTTAARAELSDAALVKQSFARFVAALGARDADAGARLLSAASFPEWQRLRALALHGVRAEIAAQPPGRRLAVFALRHYAPKFLARDGTPHELVGYALAAGMADRSSLASIELGDVVAKGARAAGHLFASGLPSGFRAGFAREDDVWKLDLPATLDAAGRVVTRSADASGSSEDSVIAGLLLLGSGERPTAQIWEPLARQSDVGAPRDIDAD